ncbi:hypothetical protein BGX24_000224 [Mortierella sp. AD032]|nr:hypothetical protein BGX24_000224 [Mortierella sp. AD032]
MSDRNIRESASNSGRQSSDEEDDSDDDSFSSNSDDSTNYYTGSNYEEAHGDNGDGAQRVNNALDNSGWDEDQSSDNKEDA